MAASGVRALVAALLMVISSVGCSSDTTADGGPVECLEAAGLEDVEDLGGGDARGFHGELGYVVLVQQTPSVADAKELVGETVDGYAAFSGRYVVAGPSRSAPGAEEIVRSVAACIGRGSQ